MSYFSPHRQYASVIFILQINSLNVIEIYYILIKDGDFLLKNGILEGYFIKIKAIIFIFTLKTYN
jgi:hypothetical protein